MSEEEKAYPVKSLHEFLSELNVEWRKFWMVSLISLAASIIMLSMVAVFAFQLVGPEHRLLIRTVAITTGSVGLIYSLYAVLSQKRFASTWGHRFSKLQELEEGLIRKLEARSK